MTHIAQLITKHSKLAREAIQNQTGGHQARFNAFIAVKLNEIKERGNTGISDAVYTQVLNQAHDFVNGIRGKHY
jgi:hypothetical protein